ncbi:glycosyltransferase family 2 protein [Fundicoccus ignavus]|uniref:glycosyltransferase family 2 protein n=1 Tax=Fundicoccus ignavus TaxID=2664442 RepID=UPI00129C60A4|nr:glycosyltransferase family A protein [Fundicoccus ignavus]
MEPSKKLYIDGLVSVIIPTYGRSEFLVNCIESVINQTYDNVEIIVVDDNNPDTNQRIETKNKMQKFRNHSSITYIEHEFNKNGSAARNTGFNNSIGEFICFLDDDDLFLDKKIEKQVHFLKTHQNFQAVYCGFEKDKKQNFPIYEGELSKELLLLDYHPVTSTIMFKRETIIDLGGFDESFRRHQDYEIMLRFFEKFKIGFVNEILLYSGENDGGNMLRGKKLEDLKEYFFNTFEENISKLEKKEKGIKKKIYSRHYSRVFWSHINDKFYLKALKIYILNLIKYKLIFIKECNAYLIKYLNNKKKVI